MKTKKLVHIIDNLALGGAEKLLINIVKKIPEYEHHIILLTPQIHFNGVEKFASLHCVHHRAWANTLRTCLRIRSLVNRLEPVAIHTHLFLASFLSRLALGHDHNFIYSIHNQFSATIFKFFRFRLMEKWIYHSSQKLIAVSNHVLDDYKKEVIKCRSGRVLYNFIDDPFLEPMTFKTPGARPLKWVAVGSFKQQKNYEAMISCMEALKKTYSQSEISLDIYGDGPLKGMLEERTCDLPFICLKGKVDNLSEILDQYDAYISTSKYEGYGIAPMEALARGLPLFLSDIPVYREIYEGHAFFFTADSNVCIDFLDSFERYNSLSVEEKMERRTAGHQYAAKVANSEKYISQLVALYENGAAVITEKNFNQ